MVSTYAPLAQLVLHGLLLAFILWRMLGIGPGKGHGAKDPDLRAYLNEYLVMNAYDGLVISDMSGRVEWANPAYLQMQGHRMEEIQGLNPLSFALPPDQTPPKEEIDAFRFDPAKHGTIERATFINQRPNGELFHNHITFIITPPHRRFGQKALLVCRDITEQIEAEGRLRDERDAMKVLSERDPLTGLANRARLMTQLDMLLADRVEGVGVMQIDLDHFKAVNDTHGHAAGDAVIIYVADVLAAVTGPDDLAARIGGDEFVLLVADAADHHRFDAIAEEVQKAFEDPVDWNGLALNVGCSIGTSVSEDATTADALLAEADHALYQVKENGRGGVQHYNADARRQQAKGKRNVAAIAAALDQDDLAAQLQPIHDIHPHRTSSMLLSMYMHHGGKGHVPVDSVVDLTESAEVLRRVTLTLAEHAASHVKSLSAKTGRQIHLCLAPPANGVATAQLLDPLKWSVERHGLDPGILTVMLHEAQLATLGNRADDLVAQISDAGFRVGLGDFGAQSAPLSYLMHLPVTSVHLAPRLTHRVDTDPKLQKTCRAIIDICAAEQITATATGIASQAELDTLARLGCTGFLGPHISPPLTPEDAGQYLAATARPLTAAR